LIERIGPRLPGSRFKGKYELLRHAARPISLVPLLDKRHRSGDVSERGRKGRFSDFKAPSKKKNKREKAEKTENPKGRGGNDFLFIPPVRKAGYF